ncbi:MAG TPA: MFS transporter [Burkholderiales bacterium]|nr:MFS transporter [Burkholderiales bacterium]
MIGRIPMSITGLAILLFVQSKAGSFALAGVVSALYVLGLAVLAPFLGRLIDRVGPKPVLSVSAVMYPAALTALVLLVTQSAQSFWIAACAAVAGAAMPPITVCMRALYPQLLKEDNLLQTAYSLDSALIEMIFILGPNLVAAFVAIHYTQGAMLFAAASAPLGSLVFLRSPAIKRWKLHAADPQHSLLGPLHDLRLLALFAVTVLYSAAFGLFEVAVTGFATGQGAPAAAGVILGLASVGSALGVLMYGSRDWALPVTKQLLFALAAMAAGILLVVPVTNLYWFTVVAIIGCAPMSVALAATSTLISRLAPRAMLAESFTWMATCLLAGISAGIAAGGILVEHFSPVLVFIAAAAVTALAGIIAWLNLLPIQTQAEEKI